MTEESFSYSRKAVCYFYPSSPYSKQFNLPNGGYAVEVTTFALRHNGSYSERMTAVSAHESKAEARIACAKLPHEWSKFTA